MYSVGVLGLCRLAEAPAFCSRDEWQSLGDTCEGGNVAAPRVPAKLCQAVLQPWGLRGVSSLVGKGTVQEQPPKPCKQQQQHQCKSSVTLSGHRAGAGTGG